MNYAEQDRKDGDPLRQVLVEWRPRARQGMVLCLLVGLVLLVISAQSRSGEAIGVIGVALLVPFGLMAAKGVLHQSYERISRHRE